MAGAGSADAGGRSHWGITAALIVADVIGGGVLALPGTIANLGWICGTVVLLLLGYVSLYTGQLIGRLHVLYPFVKSYGDLGAEFFGKRGRLAVSALAYLQMFGLCVVFLVGMTIFTNQAAESAHLPNMCFVTSAAALSVAVLVFAQTRDLHGVGQLACWIALPTLYVALALFFYELFHAPTRGHVKETNMLPPFGPQKTTVALMSIVLTYAGHVVYFELIADMKHPRDFKKAVFSSQAVIVTTYMVVALPVYMVLGNGVASPFQESLPSSIAVGVADISMILHVLISLLLNHHVISKLLFNFMASTLARLNGGACDDLPFGSRTMGLMAWMAATATVTAGAWLTANLVPFFSDIMALLSSVSAVNLTYGFPAAAALLQHQRELKQSLKREAVKQVAQLESGTATQKPAVEPDSDEGPPARVFTCPRIEVPFCWLIVVLSAVMMVYGTVNAIADTINTWASISRRPFGC